MTGGEFKKLLKTAEGGDAEMQYRVGCAYYAGDGVEKNLAVAAEWFLRAAEQGHTEAAFNYALMLETGAVEQDFYEAAKWYKKAADNGHAKAQNNLGVCYRYGNGVDQSYEEAARYYILAAEGGSRVAMCNLASFYYNGLGVGQDYNKAFELYEKSAAAGYKNAEVGLARCYEMCAGVRDPIKAFGLFKSVAEGGDAIAQYNLAVCYAEGKGTAKDEKTALEWFEKSAKQDYLPAQLKAADMHWNNGNFATAVRYYDYARGNGDMYAQFSYAYALYYGKGIREDKSSALFILGHLAENGNENAADMLAHLHARGIETDHAKISREELSSNSFLYFDRLHRTNSDLEKRRAEEAALFTCKSDDAQTVFECGEDYYYGRNGKTKHRGKAILQYEKAAGLGHALSMFKAGMCYRESVHADDREHATDWFKKAADAGYRGALKYLYGIDEYLKRAVELGDKEACFVLGEKCLKEGDEKGAVEAFVKGYVGGNDKCYQKLCSETGEQFKAYRLSEAERGEAWAQYLVAEELLGEGNDGDAREWYKKAALQGYGPACDKLANDDLLYGDGGERLDWLLKAKNCSAERAFYIAFEYHTKKDYEKAAVYYESALDGYKAFTSMGYRMRYLEIAENLSDYYYKGLGVEQNYARALELKLIIADAELTDKYALPVENKNFEKIKSRQYYTVGHCYQHGLGCEVDYDKAEEYYKRMPLPEQHVHGDELNELLSHKCRACDRYFYNTIEKRGVLGTVLLCPHCGKKVGKKGK